MGTHLELWTDRGSRLVRLDADRVSLGKASSNDIVIDDAMVSRLHAVLEHYPSGWAIRDLGSRNGTYVNGDRITGERALRSGDQIRIGDTQLTYRADAVGDTPVATSASQPAPELTRRERDVLVELCRPVLDGSMLNEPASVREIAQALVITDSAVKKHLARLFDKFGLHGSRERRRGRLAGAAVRTGAVTLSDIRPT